MASAASHSDRDAARSERPKQQALPFSESSRERLLLRARRALLIHALKFQTATIDDVRALVAVPPGVNPTVFGSVPTPLAHAGIIQFHGFAKTARKKAHGRRNTIWRLHDRDAAKVWLTQNPDVDDATPTPTTGTEG